LSAENLSNLTPHPLKVFLSYSVIFMKKYSARY